MPFVHAMGDIGGDGGPQLLQSFDQDGGGGDPISVKVAVNGDAFSGKQGAVNPGYRLVHIGKEKGVSREAFVGGKKQL
jgi:hypothetical protein